MKGGEEVKKQSKRERGKEERHERKRRRDYKGEEEKVMRVKEKNKGRKGEDSGEKTIEKHVHC